MVFLGIWLNQSLKRDWILSEKGDLKFERDMRVLLLPWKIGGHMASDCGWRFRARVQLAGIQQGEAALLWLEGVRFSQPEGDWRVEFYTSLSRPPPHPPAKLLSLASACSVMPLAGDPAKHTQTSDIQNQSWWIGAVSSHQVCGHLLQGNKRLRYTPGVCRQPLLHPRMHFNWGWIKMLHLSWEAWWLLARIFLVIFAEWYQMLICMFIS